MQTEDLYRLFQRNPSVQTDSRKIQVGDLFFALKGVTFNGNLFAENALANGAAFAVVDDPAVLKSDRYILVEDVMSMLQNLAWRHRRGLQIPVIAITGSNGKTTTKELIAATLSAQYKTYATEGNLNNHIGVPLTLLRIPQNAEMAIVEMGANHQHEIESYCKIAEPTHGLITNCGKAHLEGFGSEAGIRKAKGELYDYLRDHQGVIFRNSDFTYLSGMAQGIERQITYGSANAKYVGRAFLNELFLHVVILTSGLEMEIATQLVGSYNFANVMAAVAVGHHFGLSPENIRKSIADYQPGNSRSQLIKLGTNDVILDAYNANPTSMSLAIRNFAALRRPHAHLWLGSMKEMGSSEQKEHQHLVDLIGEFSWAGVILIGKEFEKISSLYPWFPNATSALPYLKKNRPEHATILIKGSRSNKLETLLEVFT